MIRSLIEEIANEAILNSKVAYDGVDINDRLRSAAFYLGNIEGIFSEAYRRTLAKKMQDYKEEADRLSAEINSGARYAEREREVIKEIEKERPYIVPDVVAAIALLALSLILIFPYGSQQYVISVDSRYIIPIALICSLAATVILAGLTANMYFYNEKISDKADIARKASELVAEDSALKDEMYLFCNIIMKYLATPHNIETEEPETKLTSGRELVKYIEFPAS